MGIWFMLSWGDAEQCLKNSFPWLVLGQIDFQLASLHAKMSFRWILDINLKGKTIKLLENKAGKYIQDHKCRGQTLALNIIEKLIN